MKLFKTLTSQSVLNIALIFLVFMVSRVWVLQHPPASYSDVKQDYERYANMWRYGLTPYREHLFEYPPAAVPILSIPLDVDQAGIGYYYLDYRIEIFLFEIVLFGFLLATIIKLPVKKREKVVSIAFYILAGMIAKDYWYEGLDLIFFGTFSILLCWVYLADQAKLGLRIVTWALFWLTVALKIVTAPLLLPLFLLRKLELKKELLAIVIGGVLVWGIPVMLYRSSLQVFMVAISRRPMKYGAFGSYVVEVVNNFTHTEVRVQEPPDFQMSGPVATAVTNVMKVVYPVAIAGVLFAAWYTLRKNPKLTDDKFSTYTFLLQTTLLYVFVTFLTSKTFSSPFHIWYVPLLALYPFKSRKTQLASFALAFFMLGLDTTPYLAVPKVGFVGPITLTNVRDGMRFVPMVAFVIMILRWMRTIPVVVITKRKR